MASVSRASVSRSVSDRESATTLPEIPLLAPLQPIPIPGQRNNDVSAVTASSVTSHDTFMTALTSSASPTSPSTKLNANLIPPHSLRKSLSVDSFIKNRRSPDLSEAGPSSSVHPSEYSRDSFDSDSAFDRNGEAWPSKPSISIPPRPPRATPSKSFASRILGRSRGHSLSATSIGEYDDPYLDDSEQERTSDMAHLPLLPTNRSRSASSPHVNGYGKSKRTRPGDVLLLPPRTPTLSTTSSASSLSSAPNSNHFADPVPPVPPIPHPHTRRTNIPGPLVMPHRTRSESLGGRHDSLPNGNGDVSIAVVGAPKCGKTTVIRKGLKTWGLSDESDCSASTSKGRLCYTSRTVIIPPGQQSARLVHVFELDSDTLQLDSHDGAWPEGLPRIDGVLVCYNASDLASFARVPDLLACYQALHLSAVAMACKCDLEKKVPPHWASDRAQQYNVGLIEVTCASEAGKKKMRHCFSWLLRAVTHGKRGEYRAGSPYRNPASPDVLTAPWSDVFPEPRSARGSTPSAGSPSGAKFREHPLATSIHMPASPPGGSSTPTPRSPSAPTSPTRVRSTGDLLSEVERSKRESLESRGIAGSLGRVASASAGSLHEEQEGHGYDQPDQEGAMADKEESNPRRSTNLKDNDPPPMPWATLDELLEKLFFLAVSGDDSTFIDHFFLTYRKFATPCSVLVGMQKRIHLLNQDHTDMLLGSYAQMRICDLLEEWIEQYPNDFATRGANPALRELINQLLLNPSTVHYGSDLLPFLDELPHLEDADASWGIKDDSPDEGDQDGVAVLDGGNDEAARRDSVQAPSVTASTVQESATESTSRPPHTTRERKGSLSSKSLLSNPLTTTLSGSSESSKMSSVGAPKASIKDLLKVSQALSQYDLMDIAEEITRQQSELFMAIEPRQWLRYTMGGYRPESDRDEPISGSAAFYNRLSNWVTSLILAHDRIKTRSRQVERFSELAGLLRSQNNYAGLRAVMTGINNATYPNDEVMLLFMQNKRLEYKQYRGWEVLLNSSRNHRAYRMALKHTNGPAIPDMEVHTFDMVRAHESNDDHKANDPTKIHWGKFTLMARMITTLHGFQKKINSTHKYEFTEQPHIKRLMTEAELMDDDMQRARVIPPPDDSFEVPYPTALHPTTDSPNGSRSDARFKRLFFW